MNHDEQSWFNNFEAIRFGDAVWETERGAFHCSVRRLHPLAIFVVAFAIDFDFFDQLHDRLPCSSCFRATFLFFESPLTSRVLPRLFFSFLVAHLNSAFANVLAVCVWGGSGVGGREGTRSRFSGPAPSGPSSDGAVFNKSFYSKTEERASGAPACRRTRRRPRTPDAPARRKSELNEVRIQSNTELLLQVARRKN